MLTEKDAWRLLAGLWLKSNALGRVSVDNSGCMGLCGCIHILLYNGHISERVQHQMHRRIDKEARRRGLGSGDYLWPDSVDGAKARAEFCETQANRRSLWSFFR